MAESPVEEAGIFTGEKITEISKAFVSFLLVLIASTKKIEGLVHCLKPSDC